MVNIFFVMPSMSGGGAERVVSILANRFATDYKVTIFLVEKNIVEYNLDDRISIDTRCIHGASGIRKQLSKLFAIRKLMKQNPEGIFISFLSNENLYTSIASTGLNVKIILSERNDPYVTIKSKFMKFITNRLYGKRQCKAVVFQTDGAKSFYSNKVQKKGIIIFNPLKNNLPSPYNGIRQKKIVAFARLEPQKNYELLICAFEKFSALHPEYTLDIYGKGTMEEKLKELVALKHLESRINFCGFCSNIHEIIRDASMFALSSDYEGLSNSMLEAMAIGLPVVCTDCPPGGARLFINSGENGLLTPVGDVDAMYKAMCYMAEHPDEAQRMGENASEIRQQLSVDKICSEWEKIILE